MSKILAILSVVILVIGLPCFVGYDHRKLKSEISRQDSVITNLMKSDTAWTIVVGNLISEKPEHLGYYEQNGDWISVWRIHGEYLIDASPYLLKKLKTHSYAIGATPYDVTIKALKKVEATDSSAVKFAIETLFFESKLFTNLKHSQNSDGSIDRGGFGLSSNKYGPETANNPLASAECFARYEYPKVRPYKRSIWYSLYSDRTLWLDLIKLERMKR